MSKGLRISVIAFLTLLVTAIIAFAGLCTFSTPRHLVALGTPIRQDDFTYTVRGVGRTSQISNSAASAKANGIFYIVTIRVDNQARKVDFKWDERIPHMVDSAGDHFDKSRDGQAALDASIKPRYSIPPGESRSFQAVFDVPATIDKPALTLENGILMGDIFNLVAYRRIGVMLY